MRHERTDVLVVGAGPVGLTTAMFLARQGVRTVVVERRSTISRIPRATGVHARTMEVFRAAGLEPRLQATGMKFANLSDLDRAAHAAGRETPLAMYAARSLADLDEGSRLLEDHDTRYERFSPSWPLWCGQDRYEPILLEDAVGHGADVRFRTRLVEIEQDADRVRATVTDADGEASVVEAAYLVGTDGVNSTVRGLTGIGVQSHGVADRFVSIIMRADVDVRDKPPFTFVSLSHPEVPGLIIAIEPGRWMIGAIRDPERGHTSDIGPDEALAIARTATGDPSLEPDIESVTPWEARHQVADAYAAGRVLLAGDAAHCHPPAGGFGVNTGIQDGQNLAWKLAAVLQGWAGPELVDTYEAERRPVGVATSEQAWNLFATRAKRVGEADLGDGERASVHRNVCVSTGYRYRSGALLGVDPEQAVVPAELRFDGRPGSRVPHVWLRRDGAGEGEGPVSTIDLLGEGFVLLAAGRGGAWARALESAATALGVPARAHRLGADVHDVDTRPEGGAGLLGIGDAGALLVRPDGFVAWRIDRAPAGVTDESAVETLAEVLARLVASPRLTPSPA